MSKPPHICDTNPHQFGEWIAYDETFLSQTQPYRYWRECARMGCYEREYAENLIPMKAGEIVDRAVLLAENTQLAGVITELEAILDWITQALDGKEISDFGQSFPPVRKVADLYCEVTSLREETTRLGHANKVHEVTIKCYDADLIRLRQERGEAEAIVGDVATELNAARAEVKALQETLALADLMADAMQDALVYVPEYFRKKWEHDLPLKAYFEARAKDKKP